MTVQLGTTLRDNMIGQYETTVNASGTQQPKLQIRTGAQPANCAAADSGTLLDTITLPVDFLTAASSGGVSKNGTWAGGGAAAAGTAAHYRLYNNALTVCHEQGSVGMGSGDLSLDNTSIGVGQIVTVTSWSRTQGGA